MQAIRKRCKRYAVLCAVCVLLMLCFAAGHMRETALAFGGAGITLLILFIFQSRVASDAGLICDNSILTVPSAVVSDLERSETKTMDETVVSTFGALVGDKVYKWGCDGLNGSRLQSIEIDSERISLTFGNKVQTLKLELLHGLDNEEKVSQVKQKFLHETGVEATVSGW